MQFKLLPVPHIIRIKDFKDWRAGTAKLMLISIDPKHAGNERLYRHELVHVVQMYIGLLITLPSVLMFLPWIFSLFCFSAYGLAYTFIPEVRARAEAMAYGIAAHYGDSPYDYMEMGANSLSKRYKLPKRFTKDRCERLIHKWFYFWEQVK